ncbi:MAG: hypothetical protein ABIM89_18830, partial [Mycobacteriales bacterium]
RTLMRYDTSGRLERIEYPNGIDEVYDYAPSWIGSTAWPSTDFSGMEIRFYAREMGAEFVRKRRSLVFHKRRDLNGALVPWSRPYKGDLLYRYYYQQGEFLTDLANPSADATYTIPPSGVAASGAQFVEYGYVPGTALVARVSQGVAVSVTGSVTSPIVDVVCYQYGVFGGRARVQQESLPLEGLVYTFSYAVDGANTDAYGQNRLQSGTRTDNLGGLTPGLWMDTRGSSRRRLRPGRGSACSRALRIRTFLPSWSRRP